MRRASIQEEARRLQLEIWKHRESLFPRKQVTALQVLEPKALMAVLGVEYLELPNLSDQVFPFRGRHFETAGLLDRQAGKIAVSTKYTEAVTRFTAGHEAGHWALHPHEVMHRDRPLDGSPQQVRPPQEKEADYFSACFYMPEKLVRATFEKLFQTGLPFVFHETHAYHVCPERSDVLLTAPADSLERELALARCRSFGGNHFHSLAEIFRVSEKAMAIRLRELGLVQWP